MITKRNGEAWGEAMAEEKAQAMAGNIEPLGLRKGKEEPPLWGGSIDGTTILTREGWKEVKLGAVFQFGEISAEMKGRNISYQAGIVEGIGGGGGTLGGDGEARDRYC